MNYRSNLVRFLLSLFVGFLVFCWCATIVVRGSGDWTWAYRGAGFLLAGDDPYARMLQEWRDAYPYNAPLYYPLPAVLAAAPFVALGLDAALAAPLFLGLSVALLAFALSAGNAYWRWLLFLSAPFYGCVGLVQWAPLLMAAALLPSFGWFLACKPTLGVAAWVYNPSRRSALLVVLVFALSFLVYPGWLSGWIAAARDNRHGVPILLLPGPLLWLSWRFLAWREGRLLFAASWVPQLLGFYDQTLLFLIPRTWRQMAVYVLLSWVAMGIGFSSFFLDVPRDQVINPWFDDFIVVTMFYPALALLVWQHRGEVRWRLPMRLPRPVRGV